MKKYLIVFIVSFISIATYASTCNGYSYTSPNNPPPQCSNNPQAGNTCLQAVPICDLNGYCGNTSASYTVDSWSQLTNTFSNSCGGASIENNSFLKFTAAATSMSLNIWLTHCECGDGIQIMVFKPAGNCSGAVTSYGCWSPGSATGGPSVLNVTGLTVGQEYYLMIDGYSGDDCDYIIGVNGANGGIALPPTVTPHTATICLGESVNLTASQGDGTYSWDASPDLNVTTGANVVATPATVGTHTYTVNSLTGNINCPNNANSTATITVESCCPVNAANSGTVCVGETVDLFANIVDPNIPIASYAWTGPNGFTSSQPNPTNVAVPGTPGSYTYTLKTISNGEECTTTTTVLVNNCLNGCDIGAIRTAFGAAGCIELTSCVQDCSLYFLNPQSMTGSQAQAFAQNLGANLVSIQSAQENQCILSSLNAINQTGTIWIGLNDEAVEGTFVWYDQSPVTYTNWAPGEPNNQGGSENCVQIYPGGTAPGTWNDLSCTTGNSKSIIEVNLCPVVKAGPDITICNGETAQVLGESTILGSHPYTYQWNNGPTTLSNPVTPTTATSYVLKSTDRYGCVGRDTMQVVVKTLPVVNAGNDITVCDGSSVTLTGTGGTPSWNNGVTNGVAFTPAATGTYIYTGTLDGCTQTDTVLVTVKSMPTAAFVPDRLTGCSPLPIIFMNQSVENGVTYKWDFGDGSIVTAGADTSHTFMGEGCFTVTLTADKAGCIDVVSYTDLICVEYAPIAEFTPTPATMTVLDTYTMFENTSQHATSYVWDFGDGSPTSVIEHPSHVFPNGEAGAYTVTLIASSDLGCRDTMKLNIIVEDDIIYYVPNAFTPDEDEFNPVFKPIFTTGFDPHDYCLSIYNRWGELVFQSYDVNYGWDGTFSGAGGRVQDGSYTWKIEFKTKRSDERKVIHGMVNLIR